jgi:ribosomal protein S13
MARIAGVNIPENKHVEISLTHIFRNWQKDSTKYL